jgi:hypothetical protein
MCSIICWIWSIWEDLGWTFRIFGLIHALSTRGRSLSKFWATECIRKVFRCFRAFSGICVSLVWPVVVTGLTGQGDGPIHMLSTGPIGGVDRSDRSSWADAAALFHQVFCTHSSRGSCIGLGADCMCARGALCGFRALVWWFVLFAWA